MYSQTRQSQGSESVRSCFKVSGVPRIIHLDNTLEFVSKYWKKIMETYVVVNTYTELDHPNENLSERRGGYIKCWTTHILTITIASLD